MVAAASFGSAAWRRERVGPRALVLAIVVLFHLGLLLAVLLARAPAKLAEPATTVVRLIPLPPAPAPAPARAARAPRPVAARAATRVPRPIVTTPPVKDAPPPALFTTELMEAVDISKLPSHRGEASAAAGNASGADSAATYGPGGGPHGERLYAAEWYREPTDAEVAPYLSKARPGGGTADIACRTIEHFGVEDCVELGETPPGSGLSRALRQAAWQFKVRPPRVGGKTEVGAWVRIHYTITVAGEGGG